MSDRAVGVRTVRPRWQHLALALALPACIGPAFAAGGRDLVLSVPLGDPEMQAAVRRARAELPAFFARHASPAPDEAEFMIAYDIMPGDEEELVWVADIVRGPGSVSGVLLSQPQRAAASASDRVTVPEPAIVDWIYRKGRTMQGGYTYRVLIGRMSDDESMMLREHLGW